MTEEIIEEYIPGFLCRHGYHKWYNISRAERFCKRCGLGQFNGKDKFIMLAYDFKNRYKEMV